MQSAGHDHPLRSDPLHSLPDAIVVPRRTSKSSSSLTTSAKSPSSPASPTSPASPDSSRHRIPRQNLAFATSSFDNRTLANEALSRFEGKPPTDPLLSAVVERATPLPSPPAGQAFATDINAFLSSFQLPAPDASPPVAAAGNVHRADVSLLPADSEQGGAAGVYIVRSRRNWALVESSSYTTLVPSSPSSLPSTTSTQSPSHDYYRVRRSLADFAWLHQRLIAKYDGIIVPSLPPMVFSGRVTHGFTHDAQRRRGLQHFLRRVATHPVLSTGDEVLTFLGATGEDAWRKIRREPIVKDSSVTDMLFGATREDGQNTPLQRVGIWGEKLLWQTGKRFNQGLVWFLDGDRGNQAHNPDDSAKARFERLQSYIQQLGTTLTVLRGATARVAKNRAQELDGLQSLQKALHMLAHREGGNFGANLERIMINGITPGASALPESSVSEFRRRHGGAPGHFDETDNDSLDVHNNRGGGTGAAAQLLDEVLSDYEERTKGAMRIMSARQEEQEAYERALSTYKKLRDRLEQRTDSIWEGVSNGVLHGDGEKELNDLVRQVNLASSRLTDVRKHYQSVAVRTTDELRRLRKELHEDLCEALEYLAKELVREHLAQVAAWAHLAELVGEYRERHHQPE